jgi:hypothetical protein
MNAIEQRIAEGDNFVGNGFEKIRAHPRAQTAITFERFLRMMQRAIDIRRGGLVNGGFEAGAVQRARGVESLGRIGGWFAGDDAVSVHRCCMERAVASGK